MPGSKPNPSRLIAAIAIVAAPVAAGLAELAEAGCAGPVAAAGTATAAIALIAIVVGSQLRRLATISDYLGRLTRSAEGTAAVPPSSGAFGTTADIHRAAAEAGRHWSARRRELEAVVAANEAVIT